jgi:hypothetical protein
MTTVFIKIIVMEKSPASGLFREAAGPGSFSYIFAVIDPPLGCPVRVPRPS